MHFASYYRWLVLTRYWQLPVAFTRPVLDVGADDGAFLAQMTAPLKVGSDYSARPGVAYPWLQADGRTLPFAAGSFGHVLAFDVIEHVEEDGALLHEAIRVLAPGGTLWISTPAHRFFMVPGGFVQRRFERSIGHVRRGYTAEMLRSRLPAGVDVAVFWWPEPLFRLLYVSLYLLKRLHPALPGRVMRPLVWLDAHLRPGGQHEGTFWPFAQDSGHLFARVTKPGREIGPSL